MGANDENDVLDAFLNLYGAHWARVESAWKKSCGLIILVICMTAVHTPTHDRPILVW